MDVIAAVYRVLWLATGLAASAMLTAGVLMLAYAGIGRLLGSGEA